MVKMIHCIFLSLGWHHARRMERCSATWVFYYYYNIQVHIHDKTPLSEFLPLYENPEHLYGFGNVTRALVDITSSKMGEIAIFHLTVPLS